MNTDPGATPNPLNPSEGSGGASSPDMIQPAQGTPADDTTKVNSLDPAGRPMEQIASEPPKKKKTGLIIGIIIALLALIGGGVAAAVILMNMNKPDAVAVAMEKLMTGKVPANMAIDGSIDISLSNAKISFKKIKVDLDSKMVVGSAINASSATMTLTDRGGEDYSVKLGEVYADSGDLYIKIDGAVDFLEDSPILDLMGDDDAEATNCVSDASGMTNCAEVTTDCVGSTDGTTDCAEVATSYSMASAIQSMLLGIAEKVDGEWLKISMDEVGQYSGGAVSNSAMACVADLASGINKNSNTAAQLYGKYPFISSTTEGVKVASKGNPVYLVSIDNANLASFVNSVQNSNLVDDLYDCLGWSDTTSISVEDAAKAVEALPKLYVEVNDNNDFTRAYLEFEAMDGDATVAIDLGFSYPNNVNISEPVEYINFSTLMQEIMSSMFTMQVDETTVVDVTTTESSAQ